MTIAKQAQRPTARSIARDYDNMRGIKISQPATWRTRQLLGTYVWGEETRHHEQIAELLEHRGISVDMLNDEIDAMLDRLAEKAEV